VRGLSVLVVLAVDVLVAAAVAAVVVVLGVLHAGLHGVAPRSAVGAGATAWPGGVDDRLGLSSA